MICHMTRNNYLSGIKIFLEQNQTDRYRKPIAQLLNIALPSIRFRLCFVFLLCIAFTYVIFYGVSYNKREILYNEQAMVNNTLVQRGD